MSSTTTITPSSATVTRPTVRGAHLVGSINLADADAVFTAVALHLGEHAPRIPDGEVGERYYWIQFQLSRFDATPGLVRVGEEGPLLRGEFDTRPIALDGTVPAEALQFPNLGYADAAIESYSRFATLRDASTIPAGTRFQVSLPTPAAVIGAFFADEVKAAVEPVYERALFADLARILDAIPHADLAIQWDTAVEFGLLEQDKLGGAFLRPWFDDVLGGVVTRAVRQAAAVPSDVQVGFHLCYGDVEETHFAQPTDAGVIASVLSGLFAGASRAIDWVHLPVPIERDDAAYFAPLAELDVPADTDVFLGLVHHEDGVEGAGRRIAAAASALPRFGVATECGFGRGPAERTAPLLDLHREIIEAAAK